jgi:hypothetical protein
VGGAVAGLLFGPPRPTGKAVSICIGLSIGEITNQTVKGFKTVAKEKGLESTKANGLAQCKLQACVTGNPPPNICQQLPF